MIVLSCVGGAQVVGVRSPGKKSAGALATFATAGRSDFEVQ
jgi:hypothetical protein